MGVEGGGGGLLFGLRIDHVLQAIVGTPLTYGYSSPPRTIATLQQPLMALCEVAYADVLLPLLDTVVVISAEWQYVDEKVYGIIAKIVSYTVYYNSFTEHFKKILSILFEFYEMMCCAMPRIS